MFCPEIFCELCLFENEQQYPEILCSRWDGTKRLFQQILAMQPAGFSACMTGSFLLMVIKMLISKGPLKSLAFIIIYFLSVPI